MATYSIIKNPIISQRTHDTTHDTPFTFSHFFLSIANHLGHTKDTLITAESENSHIQTQQKKQRERAEESCRKLEEKVLERRRQNMPRKREDT